MAHKRGAARRATSRVFCGEAVRSFAPPGNSFANPGLGTGSGTPPRRASRVGGRVSFAPSTRGGHSEVLWIRPRGVREVAVSPEALVARAGSLASMAGGALTLESRGDAYAHCGPRWGHLLRLRVGQVRDPQHGENRSVFQTRQALGSDSSRRLIRASPLPAPVAHAGCKGACAGARPLRASASTYPP